MFGLSSVQHIFGIVKAMGTLIVLGWNMTQCLRFINWMIGGSDFSEELAAYREALQPPEPSDAVPETLVSLGIAGTVTLVVGMGTYLSGSALVLAGVFVGSLTVGIGVPPMEVFYRLAAAALLFAWYTQSHILPALKTVGTVPEF